MMHKWLLLKILFVDDIKVVLLVGDFDEAVIDELLVR